MVLMRPQPWQPEDLAHAEYLAETYAHALRVLAPGGGGLLPRRWRSLRLGLAGALGLVVLGLIPVKQSVIAPATVGARDPLVVTAPLDGVIEAMDVAPNPILGEHGVNIANFALGRERSGTAPVKALAVVQVDAPVSQAVLDALKTIEALLEAKLVQL